MIAGVSVSISPFFQRPMWRKLDPREVIEAGVRTRSISERARVRKQNEDPLCGSLLPVIMHIFGLGGFWAFPLFYFLRIFNIIAHSQWRWGKEEWKEGKANQDK